MAENVPLVIAVGVLPCFGILMYALNLAGARSPLAFRLVTRDAAIVYTAVLVAGVLALVASGSLGTEALIAEDVTALGVAAGVLLIVPCAVGPYVAELWASSRLSRGRGIAPAAATMLPDAQESVNALVETRARFGAVALTTALAEEALFRGALLASLSQARGALLAVAVSSLIFGLHHVSFGLPAVFGKTVAGLSWSASMLLAGVLLIPVLSHLLFQALVYRRLARTVA